MTDYEWLQQLANGLAKHGRVIRKEEKYYLLKLVKHQMDLKQKDASSSIKLLQRRR